MGDVSNPTTYKEAIVSPQSNFLIDAMNIPLRRLERACRPSILDDYIVYL